MKRYYLYICMVFLLFPLSRGYAQQDAIYSQYMFNPFAINPAYAGSRDALSAVILGRQQWAGLDGAPFTGSVAIHGPIKASGLAGGFNIIHDELGPTSTNGAFLTGAYHLKLSKGKLAFGLRGGLISSTFDYNKLNYNQPDNYSNIGAITEGGPSFDFGMYYYTQKFFAGLSTTHIGTNTFDHSVNDTLNANIVFDQHYMLASGLAIEVNDNFVFKPSIMAKYVQGAPLNVDVNMSFLFKKVFWFGMSYRHGSALTFITEYNITDWMRLGYSYDLVLNRLKRFNSGSHELFIGFDFLMRKDKDISPRYM